MRGITLFGLLAFLRPAAQQVSAADNPPPDPDQTHIIKEVLRIIDFFGNATEAMDCFQRLAKDDRAILHRTRHRCENCMKDDKCIFLSLPETMDKFDIDFNFCLPRVEPLPRGMLLVKVHEDKNSCSKGQ